MPFCAVACCSVMCCYVLCCAVLCAMLIRPGKGAILACQERCTEGARILGLGAITMVPPAAPNVTKPPGCFQAAGQMYFNEPSPAYSHDVLASVHQATRKVEFAQLCDGEINTQLDMALPSTCSASTEYDATLKCNNVFESSGRWNTRPTPQNPANGSWIKIVFMEPRLISTMRYEQPTKTITDKQGLKEAKLEFSDGTSQQVAVELDGGQVQSYTLTTPVVTTSVKLTMLAMHASTAQPGAKLIQFFGPEECRSDDYRQAPAAQMLRPFLRSCKGPVCAAYFTKPMLTLGTFRTMLQYPNQDNSNEAISTGIFTSKEGRGDNYGSIVEGYLKVPADDTYTFTVQADDYADVWVDVDDFEHTTTSYRNDPYTKGMVRVVQTLKPAVKAVGNVVLTLKSNRLYRLRAHLVESSDADFIKIGLVPSAVSALRQYPGLCSSSSNCTSICVAKQPGCTAECQTAKTTYCTLPGIVGIVEIFPLTLAQHFATEAEIIAYSQKRTCNSGMYANEVNGAVKCVPCPVGCYAPGAASVCYQQTTRCPLPWMRPVHTPPSIVTTDTHTCIGFSGTCQNGELVAPRSRRMPNHCGTCDTTAWLHRILKTCVKCIHGDGCGPDQYKGGTCTSATKGFTCTSCCDPHEYRQGPCTSNSSSYSCIPRPLCPAGQFAKDTTGSTLGSCTACKKCTGGVSPVNNCTTFGDNSCVDITLPVIALRHNTTLTIEATLPSLSILNDFKSGTALASASDWQGLGSPAKDISGFLVRAAPESPGFISPDAPYLADASMVGEHTIIYNVMDKALNKATPVAFRVVIIPPNPVVALHSPRAKWCGLSPFAKPPVYSGFAQTTVVDFDRRHASLTSDYWNVASEDLTDAAFCSGPDTVCGWATRGNITAASHFGFPHVSMTAIAMTTGDVQRSISGLVLEYEYVFRFAYQLACVAPGARPNATATVAVDNHILWHQTITASDNQIQVADELTFVAGASTAEFRVSTVGFAEDCPLSITSFRVGLRKPEKSTRASSVYPDNWLVLQPKSGSPEAIRGAAVRMSLQGVRKAIKTAGANSKCSRRAPSNKQCTRGEVLNCSQRNLSSFDLITLVEGAHAPECGSCRVLPGSTDVCPVTAGGSDYAPILPVGVVAGNETGCGLTLDVSGEFSDRLDPGGHAYDLKDGKSLPLYSDWTAVKELFASHTPKPTGVDLQYIATGSGGRFVTALRRVYLVDRSPPAVTITGMYTETNPLRVEAAHGKVYEDLGAISVDIVDGNLTGGVKTDGANQVNRSKLDVYRVVYYSTDKSGNVGKATRYVKVVDSQRPTIELVWPAEVSTPTCNSPAVETTKVPWVDNSGLRPCDEKKEREDDRCQYITLRECISATKYVKLCPRLCGVCIGTTSTTTTTHTTTSITTTQMLNMTNVTEGGTAATVVRRNSMSWNCGVPWVEPGFVVSDNHLSESKLRNNTVITGVPTVDLRKGDEVTVVYTVKDAGGNPDVAKRFVEIVDHAGPNIRLFGSATMTQGGTFSEYEPHECMHDGDESTCENGLDFSDACEKESLEFTTAQDVSQQVMAQGDFKKGVYRSGADVRHDLLGNYTIEYAVVDSSCNIGRATRYILVVEPSPSTALSGGAIFGIVFVILLVIVVGIYVLIRFKFPAKHEVLADKASTTCGAIKETMSSCCERFGVCLAAVPSCAAACTSKDESASSGRRSSTSGGRRASSEKTAALGRGKRSSIKATEERRSTQKKTEKADQKTKQKSSQKSSTKGSSGRKTSQKTKSKGRSAYIKIKMAPHLDSDIYIYFAFGSGGGGGGVNF